MARIEDLLDWLDEQDLGRVHIKMGMKRVGDRKLPQPYADGVTPTYPQFCPGPDEDWEGKTTDGDNPKPLWGIEDHKGSWKGFPKEDRVHAVFPHLHANKNLLILDADPGPDKLWKDKADVLDWLAQHEDHSWLLDCPYTETNKGYHFYFFVDGLPEQFPRKAKKMFKAGDVGELFGGDSWSPPPGKGKLWVWEENKRVLHNWKDEIPKFEYESTLKPLINPATQDEVRTQSVAASAAVQAGPVRVASVQSANVQPFSLALLPTDEAKHLYEVCFLVDNNGTYEDSYFLIGGALHADWVQSNADPTNCWQLSLWIHWCEGGPEDPAERERLMLDPGPPVARGQRVSKSHTAAHCEEAWGYLRANGEKRSFGSVKFYLESGSCGANAKRKYAEYKQTRVRLLSFDMYDEEGGLVDIPNPRDRKFDFTHMAELCAGALPPILVQNETHSTEGAVYMLGDRRDGVSGKWSRNSDSLLHQKLNTDLKKAFKAARSHSMEQMRAAPTESEDGKDKQYYEFLASAYADAEKKCDDPALRKKILENLKIRPGVGDDHTNDKFLEAQRKMLDKQGNTFCYFPFQNGLFNVNTGEFRPADPNEYLYFTTGYDYDYQNVAQRRQARREVFNYLICLCGGKMPDGDLVLEKHEKVRFVVYLLLVTSASLRPENYFEIITFLLGPGGNGKGKFIALLTQVFGPMKDGDQGLHRAIPAKLIEVGGTPKDANVPNPLLGGLQQTRIACVAEPGKDAKQDVAICKNFSGGDRLRARGLYEKVPVEFIPMFNMFVECNSIPAADPDDDGWGRRFREITLGNGFKKEHPDTHFITDEMVWQTMGMTKDQIKGKVSSGEWRNAMFDIMEMFYRSIFLPYTNGDLDGKFNLPHNYEINNDQSMMDALAPEWSAATAKQLGASAQFLEWFHQNYVVTVPDDVEIYREADGTLHRDFLKPATNKDGTVNQYNASVKFSKFKKESFYQERGLRAFPPPDHSTINEINCETLLTKFTADCPGASDFKRCKNKKERMLEVMRLLPKLGAVCAHNNYKFFGYRRRLDDDPAHTMEAAEEEGLSTTEKYNRDSGVDGKDLLLCLERTLVDREPLPQRYGGPTPDPPVPEEGPEPEPDEEALVPVQEVASDSQSSSTSSDSAHTYTKICAEFLVEDIDYHCAMDKACYYEVDSDGNYNIEYYLRSGMPEHKKLSAQKYDGKLAQYYQNEEQTKMAFWIGIENVPCIALGCEVGVEEVKRLAKIHKGLDSGKYTPETVGLNTADPTQTVREYLIQFRSKYTWRIYGPGNDHGVMPCYVSDYDEIGPLDLRESDTWPCDPESKFVPYGMLSIQKLIKAKVSYKEYDLRCIPRDHIKWDKEFKTETMFTEDIMDEATRIWPERVDWLHGGVEV